MTNEYVISALIGVIAGAGMFGFVSCARESGAFVGVLCAIAAIFIASTGIALCLGVVLAVHYAFGALP